LVETAQPVAPKMEDGGQAAIDKLQEINIGPTNDPKLIFLHAMLNDEEVALYE